MDAQRLIMLINERKTYLKQQLAMPIMDDSDESAAYRRKEELSFLAKLLQEIQNTE